MILYFLYETNVWGKQNSFCTLGLVGTVDVCAHSCLTLCESMDYNPITRQAPLSKGFSRQEYWEWDAISFSRGFCRD